MPHLTSSPGATRDLKRLYAFLGAKDRKVARRAITTIRQSVLILKRHPEIGRPDEEESSYLREWSVRFGAGGYVVLYSFEGGEISILAVRHAREKGYKRNQ